MFRDIVQINLIVSNSIQLYVQYSGHSNVLDPSKLEETFPVILVDPTKTSCIRELVDYPELAWRKLNPYTVQIG